MGFAGLTAVFLLTWASSTHASACRLNTCCTTNDNNLLTSCQSTCGDPNVKLPASLHIVAGRLAWQAVNTNQYIVVRYHPFLLPPFQTFQKMHAEMPNVTYIFSHDTVQSRDRSGEIGGILFADVLISFEDVFRSSSNLKDGASDYQLRDPLAPALDIDGTFTAWNTSLAASLTSSLGVANDALFASACLVDGKRVCVPYGGDISGLLIYKPTMFRKFNLSLPKTWQDLLNVCSVFKTNGVLCISTLNYNYSFFNGDGPNSLADIILVRSMPQSMYNQLIQGKLSWSNPVVVEAMRKFKYLVDMGYAGHPPLDDSLKDLDRFAKIGSELHASLPANRTAMVVARARNMHIATTRLKRAGQGETVTASLFPEVLDPPPPRHEIYDVMAVGIRGAVSEPFPKFNQEAASIVADMFSPAMKQEVSPFMLLPNYADQNPDYLRALASPRSNPISSPDANFKFFSVWWNCTVGIWLKSTTVEKAAEDLDKAALQFILLKTAKVNFDPPAGVITEKVTLTSQAGATIYFTTDGTRPDEESSVYSEPIRLATQAASATIRAVAIAPRLLKSEITTANYVIKREDSARIIVMATVIPLAGCIVLIGIVFAVNVLSRRWRAKRAALKESPSGEVAIVFADVQGSTELWSDCGPLMKDALVQMFVVMRGELEAFRGYEVKTQGDAMMAAFWNAKDAKDWCNSVQIKLLDVQWCEELLLNRNCHVVQDGGTKQTLFRGLRVRMGFHSGRELEQEYDRISGRVDYFGNDVNFAARVSSIGQGGQVVTSRSCISHVEGLRRIGEYPLKGIQGTHTIYEVPIPGVARTFSTPDAPTISAADKVLPQCGVCRRPCPTCRNKKGYELANDDFNDKASDCSGSHP